MRTLRIAAAAVVVLWAAYITWQVHLIRAEVRETCSNTTEIETRLALGKPRGINTDVRYQCP